MTFKGCNRTTSDSVLYFHKTDTKAGLELCIISLLIVYSANQKEDLVSNLIHWFYSLRARCCPLDTPNGYLYTVPVKRFGHIYKWICEVPCGVYSESNPKHYIKAHQHYRLGEANGSTSTLAEKNLAFTLSSGIAAEGQINGCYCTNVHKHAISKVSITYSLICNGWILVRCFSFYPNLSCFIIFRSLLFVSMNNLKKRLNYLYCCQ